MQPSFSRIPIVISILRKGDAEGEVFRHLAPATLSALLSRMPINGRVTRFDDAFVYILTGVVAGVEKAKKEFRRGELAFLSLNGALCIFLKDSSVAKPMNPIGKVTSGLELIEKASKGDVLTIKRKESSPSP